MVLHHQQTENNPLVSIIIPTYNRAGLIGETLQSVINQTYTNWECIVVDDGSTDNTIDVIKEYCDKDERISFHLRTSSPKGANTCRNLGFIKSKGDYIQFFDSDDLMHKDLLTKKVDLIHASDTKPDLILCKHKFFPKESRLNTFKVNLISKDYLNDYLQGKVKLNAQNTLFSKEILQKTELFDPTLVRAQEVELFSRILPLTTNIKLIDEFLIEVRDHEQSITGGFLNNETSALIGDTITVIKIYNNLLSSKQDIEEGTFQALEANISSNIHKITSKRSLIDFKAIAHILYASKLKFVFTWRFTKFMLFAVLYILTGRFQGLLYESRITRTQQNTI